MTDRLPRTHPTDPDWRAYYIALSHRIDTIEQALAELSKAQVAWTGRIQYELDRFEHDLHAMREARTDPLDILVTLTTIGPDGSLGEHGNVPYDPATMVVLERAQFDALRQTVHVLSSDIGSISRERLDQGRGH